MVGWYLLMSYVVSLRGRVCECVRFISFFLYLFYGGNMRKLDKALEVHGKLTQIKKELEKVRDEVMNHKILDFGDRYDLVQALTLIDKVINRLKGKIGEILSWVEEYEQKKEGEKDERNNV